MRRLLALTAIPIAVVAFACTAPQDTADRPPRADSDTTSDQATTDTTVETFDPPTDPPTTTTEPAMSIDDVYVGVVRAEYPAETVGLSDADLIGPAHAACDALDAGNTAIDVAMVAAFSGAPEDAPLFGFILGAGVATYCPEYGPELDAAADDLLDLTAG